MKATLSACPLDCYDGCEIVYEDGVKPLKGGYTQGFLCPHMNHYHKHDRITKPRYKGKEISMQEALDKLCSMIDTDGSDKTLFYKGSGNFGLMQDVTSEMFAQMGATLTDGSLCDGAGEAGIIQGRGSNKNMPVSEIAKSDVVIFWGRNPHTTSSHLLPLIEGKKIIVIDPVQTQIAKMADLHIWLQPHADMFFAMLFVRFLHINFLCNEEYLEKYGSEFEDYYELTQTVRIKAYLEKAGVTLGDIGRMMELVTNKKVAIVVGVGVQKYLDGADIMRSIDAVAVALGLFGKEGCGVAYLGNSKEGITTPFTTSAKKVSKVNTPFENFSTVFVQGANPLAQMPDTTRVQKSMKQVKNLVYFGLYENETSAMADLVIPAKTFLEKDDIRTSYGDHRMMIMQKQLNSDIGISEYQLASFLADKYNLDLATEEDLIEHFRSHSVIKIDGSCEVEARETIPYQDGFDTDDGEFAFLEEYDVEEQEGDFFLVTPKSKRSLNSQFYRESKLYIKDGLGYSDGDMVMVCSPNGSVTLPVETTNILRNDTVLIYSGTPGVNILTSSQHSLDGKCAIFQENRVTITKIDK